MARQHPEPSRPVSDQLLDPAKQIDHFKPEWRWLKRLLGLHNHDWRHMETHRLMPYEYQASPFVMHQVMGRDIHYRECDCGAWGQYYPSKIERAEIDPSRIFIIEPPRE